MLCQPEDTIVAIASATGGSYRGTLRLSGPDVLDCLKDALGPTCPPLDSIKSPSVATGYIPLDEPAARMPCNIYYWPNQRSYTRQRAAEIHTLGSPPLLDAVLRKFCAAGARLAEPGEFTMRAFLAGRIDLPQAEAVLGIIDATQHHDLDVALRQVAGGLSAPFNDLREHLLELLAHLEAGLDFVEEDIEFISSNELEQHLMLACRRVHQLTTQIQSRGATGPGLRVALVGSPNVGKSSLLNALVGGPVALVSGQAGTTRDYVTRQVRCGDFDCELIDTAGMELRPDGVIDLAAQEVTSHQSRDANLRVLCLDSTRPLNQLELSQLRATRSSDDLVVLTKADQNRCAELLSLQNQPILTSSVTGEGIDALKQRISDIFTSHPAFALDLVPSTSVRCSESLRHAAESLAESLRLARDSEGEELVAAELRHSLDELGKILGTICTDDILDRVFSRFCIGK